MLNNDGLVLLYQGCFSTLQCGSWIDALYPRLGSCFSNRFSTLQCGSWIDASHYLKIILDAIFVSVPFNAGRGLMLRACPLSRRPDLVSVPFNAGRGLMPPGSPCAAYSQSSFSTLQCGSWIDAHCRHPQRLSRRKFQYPSMRVVD